MTPAADTPLLELISRMTLAEKIGQLTQGRLASYSAEEVAAGLKAGRWGSRILAETGWAGNNENDALDVPEMNGQQRAAVEDSRLGIPLLFGRDVIYGHHTVYPIPHSQAASFHPELVEKACACVAREATADGVKWTFSPMLDLVRDPRWGRVIESYGEDPFLISEMGCATVRGFQGEDPAAPDRMLACAKHFAGYGGSEGGRDYHGTDWSDDTLHNMILPPFRAAVEAGLASVMSGFNQLGGQSVSACPRLTRSWLKETLGWDGFIVSDWGSILDLVNHGQAGDRREAARLALEAGIDMDMVDGLYEEELAALVQDGVLSESLIDDAVLRVLRAKQKAGLFARPYTESAPGRQRAPEHVALAVSLACQSAVLLKNDGVLPLAASLKTVAVLGPYAEARRQHLGSWCLDGRPADVTPILDGLRAELPEIRFRTANPAFSDEMMAVARNADLTILCVGESHVRNGEAKSISELSLPPGQEELIESFGRLGLPLVVVDCSGRYLPIPAAERFARAILHAGSLGTEAGTAVARLLSGAANPSGKLPMTIPRTTGQIPLYYNVKRPGSAVARTQFKGYEEQLVTPLYPFGYGLSYTEFALENIVLSADTLRPGETVTLRAELRNCGNRAGAQVVQLYLQAVASNPTRPVRELKAFQRVELDPGASCVLAFTLGEKELGCYLPTGVWTVPSGSYRLALGFDSTAAFNAQLTYAKSRKS